MIAQTIVDDDDDADDLMAKQYPGDGAAVVMPRQSGMNAPGGYGYYYPSKIYQLPPGGARTPGRAMSGGGGPYGQYAAGPSAYYGRPY